MEKRKLLPLSMALLCSLCFATACNTTSSSTVNVIATINGSKIITDSIYANALYSEDTASYVYSVLEKALIQSVMPETNAMRTTVEKEVKDLQDSIKENAQLNGTNYKDDLKAALDEEGVSSVDELIEKKIYAKQKEYAKQKFLKAKDVDYTKAYIDDNYLYHIGDINLSISSSSTNTDLYNITISSSEAKNIYDTFTELVGGEKYYNVASKYSKGDSAKKGGDLGIVSLNDSSITNELRYALIGYSSIKEGKYDQFNLPKNKYSKVLNDMYAAGFETIPYSYIKGLNDVYSKNDTSETKNYETSNSFYYSGGGNTVSSSSKVYYRNIVFNALLNTKVPRLITVSEEDVANGARAIKMDVLSPNATAHGYSSDRTSQYVLVNEYNNPYVVFKDGNGLHILTINKTPFASDIYDYYSSEPSDTYEGVAYVEYGSNIEERKAQIDSFSEKYIKRQYGSNDGDESLLSFEMFKYYSEEVNNGGFEIIDESVKQMITQYINSKVDHAKQKVISDFEGYYNKYSNLIWYAFGNPEDKNGDKVTIVTKEIPLLSCLTKVEGGRYSCTYKYGEGFRYYEPENSGGGN